MKKIVLLFFIFFAITARVDFAKASTIANPAYTFIVSKSYNSSDRPRIDDTPFGHRIPPYLKFQEYIRSNNTNGIVSRSPSQEVISQAWAIAIPVAGVAIAGLELAVVFDQVAWTTKMSYTEASSAQMSAIAEQEPIMKLWIQAENSPSVDVSTMYNELVVNRATEAVNLIGTEFPSVDKDALRDFFILNIGTSYGFKQ